MAIILLGTSCKTTRYTATGKLKKKSAKFLFKQMVGNQVAADWMNAKAKITVKEPERGVTKFSATIRMKKDSLIWMNVKKAGVEAARIQITPDSIYAINRIDNQYIIKDFDFAREQFDLPATFEGLQQILLGNPQFFTTDFEASTADKQYVLTGDAPNYKTKYYLDSLYQLRQYDIEDIRYDRTVVTKQDDYQLLNEVQNFSFLRELAVSSDETGNVSIKINFSKVVLNEPTTFKFSIPGHYERVN